MFNELYHFFTSFIDWWKHSPRIYFPNMYHNKIIAIKAPHTFEQLKQIYFTLNPCQYNELKDCIHFYCIDEISKQDGLPETSVFNEATFQGLVFQNQNGIRFVTVTRVETS
jgi:hypothetical protein